jgi:hypothetical protein
MGQFFVTFVPDHFCAANIQTKALVLQTKGSAANR